MKTCVTCNNDKELEEFYKRNKSKDGFNSSCKLCQKQQSKNQYFRTSGKRNKHIVQRRRRLKDEFNQHMLDLGIKCEKCGFDHPAALDFHHLDPTQKKNTISTLKWAGVSQSTLDAEIAKCIVLCSNCHRIEHYENKNCSVVKLANTSSCLEDEEIEKSLVTAK